MIELDKKDREILYQLDLNARLPISSIAKNVGASKEVVGYRIKRMTELGLIKGYYAIIDLTKLGFMNARMFLKFRSIPPEEEKELIEFFIRHKRFWWVGGITSSLYDLGVACWVKDVLDFHELKDSCIGRFRNKIELLRDSFYSKIYSWRKKYLSEKHTDGMQTVISGRSISVRYDEHDVKLLTQLSIDARLPIVDLANKIGLSVTAVKHRFKRLKDKEVILGFRPKIDLEKLGVYWYKVEFQLDDYRSKKDLLAYFSSHPNAVYAYESIGGGTDLEVEFEVENHTKFREILDKIRKKFRGSIRNYLYYVWVNEDKVSYFPMAGELLLKTPEDKDK
ncbi:MAG: winged helix-turn-helix transcriptional regulator [Candidatus Micrarchaeota archaeon]